MKRYKPRGRTTKRPDKKEFDLLYYELNKSAKELAEQFGVNVATIYNWACQYRKED